MPILRSQRQQRPGRWVQGAGAAPPRAPPARLLLLLVLGGGTAAAHLYKGASCLEGKQQTRTPVVLGGMGMNCGPGERGRGVGMHRVAGGPRAHAPACGAAGSARSLSHLSGRRRSAPRRGSRSTGGRPAKRGCGRRSSAPGSGPPGRGTGSVAGEGPRRVGGRRRLAAHPALPCSAEQRPAPAAPASPPARCHHHPGARTRDTSTGRSQGCEMLVTAT